MDQELPAVLDVSSALASAVSSGAASPVLVAPAVHLPTGSSTIDQMPAVRWRRGMSLRPGVALPGPWMYVVSSLGPPLRRVIQRSGDAVKMILNQVVRAGCQGLFDLAHWDAPLKETPRPSHLDSVVPDARVDGSRARGSGSLRGPEALASNASTPWGGTGSHAASGSARQALLDQIPARQSV